MRGMNRLIDRVTIFLSSVTKMNLAWICYFGYVLASIPMWTPVYYIIQYYICSHNQ